MRKPTKFSTFTAFIVLIAALNLNGSEFRSSSTVEEVRDHISRLPEDDIWWSVTGEEMRWNNLNLQRIYPTASVFRAGPVRELKYRPNAAIVEFPVLTPSGPMGFRDFLDSQHSSSLGVVIAHQGDIVFEHYARMQAHEKPIIWSVSKVLVSAVVGILEDRGKVDIDHPIETYIPELSSSSYAGITVRNILDMATGVDCPEEYEDRSSCYNLLMQAMGETWWDEDSPDNPYEFLAGLKVGRYAEQGKSFDYGSINTDILGWLVEKVTGMPFQDALSREIWTRAGMEADAAYVAPRFGVPHWDGGFLAQMRDMVRFGLLFTPSYSVVSDRPLISRAHVNKLLDGGRPELLQNARNTGWKNYAHEAEQVKHNTWQWDLVWHNGDIYKGGWAGQGLLVNPRRDVVAVYTGYFKHDYSELPVLPRLREVLNAVYGSSPEMAE
jgi:CubicO group peptidase (beta-lactamase class C family)